MHCVSRWAQRIDVWPLSEGGMALVARERDVCVHKRVRCACKTDGAIGTRIGTRVNGAFHRRGQAMALVGAHREQRQEDGVSHGAVAREQLERRLEHGSVVHAQVVDPLERAMGGVHQRAKLMPAPHTTHAPIRAWNACT